MAKHTFLTELELTKRLGVVTDVEYDDETVDIPTKGEIREIAKAAFSIEMKKIGKIAEIATEKAKAATTDALGAREMVEKFLETARETFRDVIAELLAPHYRYLEEQLGIKPPEPESVTEKTSSKPRGRSTSASNTLKNTSGRKPPLVGANDADEVKSDTQGRRKLSVAGKKVSARAKEKANPAKKKAKNTPPKRKGAKPCPKK
jgi:hypothetical protein